ncbi:MAG: tripartite tricarboxylate transporter substrate binding protein [Betaproteobacteria bacterium]|nr:tripartite tricarboxylate transporter substrate binding protein [Betaproteobacteria bacterium]
MIRRFFCAVWGLLFAGGPALAQAPDAYPAKPVRVITSYSIGGATDIVARLVAKMLTESIGRSFIVDNVTGAGGVIGDSTVARAAPDGYTLLATSSTFAINPAVYAKLPFDTLKAFAPISLVGRGPFMLVIHPSVPAKSVKELVALAKANPGKLDYASAGQGTAVHLAVALFNSMAGVTMTHIPYKGSGQALIDLVAGQVQMTFASILSSRGHVKSGRLRALAVSSIQRSTIMPELPTVSEAGVPGYQAASWYAWFAPAGTPRPIIGRLNAAIVKGVKSPELSNRLLSGGAEPVGSAAEELGRFLADEIARWRKVVQVAGVRRK